MWIRLSQIVFFLKLEAKVKEKALVLVACSTTAARIRPTAACILIDQGYYLNERHGNIRFEDHFIHAFFWRKPVVCAAGRAP